MLLSPGDHFQRGILMGVLGSRLSPALHRFQGVIYGQAHAERRDWPDPMSFDGLLGCFYNLDLAARVREAGVAAVNLSSSIEGFDLPSVLVDNHAVGRIAADHLLERGFWRFGFAGMEGRLFSRERRAGFEAALAERGQSVSYYDRRVQGREGMAAWLESLGRPAGVLAANDDTGQHLLHACEAAGLAIPEDVAVVGVDDDPTICGFYPALSSVALPLERMGLEAAGLLEALMAGGEEPREPIRMPPMGVTVRKSSDVVAAEDPLVARAFAFIREKACEGISVGNVIDAVPLSRREFEKQCKALVGRTPLEQIHHVRLNEAQRLLTQTDLTVTQIAGRCGFGDVHHLSRWFARLTGQRPSEYREGMRG